jgi:hypothetical protein
MREKNRSSVPQAKSLIFVGIILLAASFNAASQTFQGNTNSNWNTGSNWSTGTVPSGVATDVTISSNVNVAGGSFTIGDVSVDNNTSVTIASGGTLTLGSSTLYNPPSSTTKTNLSFSNSGTLTVTGTLVIYGDLVVTNTLTLNITGSMTVYGDIVMANGGSLAVSGSGQLNVAGSILGGNNTTIDTTGATSSPAIAVSGSIDIGGGNSSISGSAGSISAGGCSCSGCSSGCPNTVLPVKILYFTAKALGNTVNLAWATTTEENFSRFVIQRSEEGLHFNDIAELPGQERNIYNLVSKYSFEDLTPVLGYNFYRLKAIDLDNSFEYFGIKSVRVQGNKSISVYPNPGPGNSISFSTNFSPGEGDRIRVLNTFGKELFQLEISGNVNTMTPLEDLTPGVYFVQYEGAEYKQIVRLLIQK